MERRNIYCNRKRSISGWIGGIEAKPDIDALQWHFEKSRQAQRGKILQLDYDPYKVSTCSPSYLADSRFPE